MISKLSGNILQKSISLTLSFLVGNLFLLVFFSCMTDPALQDPFGSCPDPRNAKAVDIRVFYSPYENESYAIASDTVAYEDFAFNFELTPELSSSTEKGTFPGQAFALSCAATYKFTNISDISIILTAPFNGLPIGTDITYLFVLSDGSLLDDLRNFENTANFFNMKLSITPENYAQLQTQTFLFLRDGTQKTFTSISPYLQTN